MAPTHYSFCTEFAIRLISCISYCSWCSVQNGFLFPFIDKAKRVMAQKGLGNVDNTFALIMDEMKIKSGLVYRKHSGELVGFCDLTYRRFLLCSMKTTLHKTRNPYDADRDLYFICDPPHLIKTARNCLSNSGSHSISRNLMVSNIILYTSCVYTIIL